MLGGIMVEVSLSKVHRVILGCSRFDLCRAVVDTQRRADGEAASY